MADEREPASSQEFNPEDEIDELFARANLNPNRVGCPPRDVLIALTRKQRSITDPAYEHLAKCSACYREFRSLQQSANQPWASTRLWIAAAAILVSFLATLYPARSATKIAPAEVLRYE